ncbi:MAG: Rrf2 family transcriptional regulator [Spirochaetes bacterium]|nr:Rrf2 family transcriptional regulator [Spirochaetota bacterium]
MFPVSSRSQYGIRALVYLARKQGHVATASEISSREGISAKYLEGILTTLSSAGLVLGERGKNGGMRLARDTSEITMRDIVQALDGQVRPVACVDAAGDCSQGGACLPRRFWLGLKSVIDEYLESHTLKDVSES